MLDCEELKIKSNIDLRELEKYGFYITLDKEFYIYINGCSSIFVFVDSRQIVIANKGGAQIVSCVITVLFDLIQAGLVEKVKIK